MNKSTLTAITCAAVLAVTSVPASAEMFDMDKLNYGLKGSLQLTNLTGDNAKLDGTNDNESRLGWAIGGTGEYEISDDLSLQAELLYSQRGAKKDASGNDRSQSLDYIDVPVNVVYTLPEMAEDVSVDAIVGFQMSYLLAAQSKVGTTETDNKDTFKSLDYGINIGGAATFASPFSEGSITGEVRYYLGLNEISDKVQNNAIQFNVGYNF